MRKKNRKKRIIIICIILLILLLIIILLSFKNFMLKKEDTLDDTFSVPTPIYIKEDENKLYPDNIYAVVYRYKGNADMTKVYNSLYRFKTYVDLLSDRCNTLTDEKTIQDYFLLNVDYIKEYTGITDIEKFKSLVEEIRKLNNSNKVFEKASIEIASIIEEEDRLVCDLDLEYNDVVLNFKFTILNSSDNNITYIYEH